MKMSEKAKNLAKNIISDFEKYLLTNPALYGYRESWRYEEIEKIIKELENKDFVEHPYIDHCTNMSTDEIVDFPDLIEKLSNLKDMLQYLAKHGDKTIWI